MSRGLGARTTLLTLNRGESGDNAIGPELFDALGLIRTEELRVADRYYGVDEQYFTTVVDYGFSKRLDEAIEKWGREHVLRDMVRVIRTERPWVIVSRWQGNERDGHGQHQAAGLLSQEAFKAAADPAQFPEQIAGGPAAVAGAEAVHGRRARERGLDACGSTPARTIRCSATRYANFARLGLSFQRSQNSGRYVPSFGPAPAYFVRLAAARRRAGEGAGLLRRHRHLVARALSRAGQDRAGAAPTRCSARSRRRSTAATQAFTMTDPSASAPALARGLTALRAARGQLSRIPTSRTCCR